ncbi:MAG TPA: putrescine aminotransferase, partial [Planctomycetaceae bacterium]|nr:putrescine aminotransferase [Planctomycetaceae bacterium]
MPLGAMMTRSDLWKKAYGFATTFALHTSTFGAGSLACAAGLATLQDRQVAENTAARSQQL